MKYDLFDWIKNHEGLKLKPYKDTVGKLTIGVGRNLDDVGISEDEAFLMLVNDVNRCESELIEIFGKDEFLSYPEPVRVVLYDMIFNLGKSRFLKFINMIQAVKDKNWYVVVREMKNSKWCRQLPKRCNDNSNLILDWLEKRKR